MGTAKRMVVKRKTTRKVPKSNRSSSLDKCPKCGHKIKGR